MIGRATTTALALLLVCAPAFAQTAGDATPTTSAPAEAAPRHHTKGDPWERFNRGSFRVHQKLDKAIFRPAALGYKSIFPKFLRKSIRNFISNLTEPIVFLNDLLQLKPKRAVKTLGRFLINSTAGVGGVLDIAKTARLPHRKNGFGNTLARYGVGPGPYLFLPFIGPSGLRDLLGGQGDALVLPFAVGHPFDRYQYQIPVGVLGGLDLRAENDAGLKALLDGAADPYATLRSVYQQSRLSDIAEVKGKASTSGLDDPLIDPEAPAGTDTPANPEAPTATDTPIDPAPPAATPAADAAPEPVAPEPHRRLLVTL